MEANSERRLTLSLYLHHRSSANRKSPSGATIANLTALKNKLGKLPSLTWINVSRLKSGLAARREC